MERCRVVGCTDPVTGRKTKKYEYLCHKHYARATMVRVNARLLRQWMKSPFCAVPYCTNMANALDHWHGHHAFKQQICKYCFRGYICQSCNVAIGWAYDDPERLIGNNNVKGLTEYLLAHPAPILKFKKEN